MNATATAENPVEKAARLVTEYNFAFYAHHPLQAAVVSNVLIRQIDEHCNEHPELREPVMNLINQWRANE